MLFNYLISLLIATSFADENKARHLRGRQPTTVHRQRVLYTPAFDFVKSTANNNYCMDMSLDIGNNVEMNPCDDEKRQTQTWHFDSSTNQIINKYDGKCLDVNTSDNNILTWKCRAKDNQMWDLEESGTIKSLWNGKCLTMHRSNNLILSDCRDGDNQRFYLTQNAETTNNRPFEEKKPTNQDTMSNYPQNDDWKPMVSFRYDFAQCVQSFEVGEGVSVENCNFDDEETQNWRYDQLSNRILNRGNGMCLDVNTSNGNLLVWSCHGQINQQWYWDNDNKLRSSWNNKCVDVNESTNGLYLSPCDEVNDQYFYL